jgi:hypothetical protein
MRPTGHSSGEPTRTVAKQETMKLLVLIIIVYLAYRAVKVLGDA